MSPVFTRDGDDGSTHLLGKGTYAKNDLRLECLGAIDEASSALGLARALSQSEDNQQIIKKLQQDLYILMTEIAASPDNTDQFVCISSIQVNWLEAQIKEYENEISPPEEFILPGDSAAGAALDLARTIVRRAERRLVDLFQQDIVSNKELLRYLNRLSSLCFMLELNENGSTGSGRSTLAKNPDG